MEPTILVLLGVGTLMALIQNDEIIYAMAMIGWIAVGVGQYVGGTTPLIIGVSIAIYAVSALNQFPNGRGR